eukprot:1536471-Pyramimonas_sp.AAC.1
MNAKTSQTVAGHVIKEYGFLLATDMLKTSDTLSHENTNYATMKTGTKSILNDESLDANYIVNMAQVVDPATNIQKTKEYKFAFVPMVKTTQIETAYSNS